MTGTPLKPCPFCGGEAEINDWGTDARMISCSDTDCDAYPQVIGKTAKKAKVKWNTRHTPAITDEDVERAVSGWVSALSANDGYVQMRAALEAFMEGR